jgi:hypothetical protein
MWPELVECRADVVEHLGGDVVREAVTDDVALPGPADRGRLAEDPQVVAGRRPAPLDDDGEVTGGKLSGLKRADDLEAGRVAEAHENALGIASRSRRQHARLGLRDRARVDDLVSSYVFLPARLRSSTLVKIALPAEDRHPAARYSNLAHRRRPPDQ